MSETNDLKNDIRPGDIINLSGIKTNFSSIKKVFETIAVSFVVAQIEETQKRVFGKETTGVKDNHTMIYLGDNKVFSTHLPKPEIISLDEFFDKKRIVRILRPNSDYFGVSFEDDRIMPFIIHAAEEIVSRSRKYDVGQLIDILINTTIGYPHDDVVSVFQKGEKLDDEIDNKKRQNLVCSVSVALIIESMIRDAEKNGIKVRRPWEKIRKGSYLDRQFFSGIGRQYPGHWDLDVVFPAQFACTEDVFSCEFLTVGLYKAGKRVFINI